MSGEKYYSLVLCGAFFTEEYVEFVKLSHDGYMSANVDNTDFLQKFFTKVDYSKHTNYTKEMVIIHSDDILYDEDIEEKGWYIGIPLYDIPEHLSIKRVCIDVRNLLTDSKFVDNDIPADAITIFSKVLKVEE